VVCPLTQEGHASRIPFLPPSSVVFDHNGRGNNWAWGYSSVASRQGRDAPAGVGLPRGTRAPLLKRAMDAVRRHAESLDSFDSLLLLHSTGGGTGSGFGCRMLEAVREEYGRKLSILDVVVLPFEGGDTPLQHYNTVLTLECAYENADGVLVLANDDLLGRVRGAKAAAKAPAGASTVAAARARSRDAGRGAVSLSEMNEAGAEALWGVLAPTRHRGALPRRVKGGGEDDCGPIDRPAWVDPAAEEREAEAARPRAFEGQVDGKEEEEGEEGKDGGSGRDGWMASGTGSQGGSPRKAAEFVRALLGAANLGDVVATGEGGGGGPSFECPPDLRTLCADLVPHPSRKLLDVRSVLPPPRAGNDSPAASWMALADALGEATPRFDSGNVRVTTHAARLYARGASVTDCDSVDASCGGGRERVGGGGGSTAPRGRTGPGRVGGRGAVAELGPWPGLPSSPDWSRVSTVLSRAIAWPGGGTPPPPRTALLSPTVPSHPRSLSLLSNCDVALPSLLHAVGAAESLLSVRAYTHWYERYGVAGERLAGAMGAVLDVVEAYRPGSTGGSSAAGARGREGSEGGGDEGGLLAAYASD